MNDVINNVPALRFSGYTLPWVKNKLGNFGVLVSGLTYSPDNIVEGGLLVLRSSNVQNSQIALTDNVYVDIDVAENNLTRKDDILICVRNGSKRLIGKNTLIPDSLPKATHGAFMTVFRGANNKFIYQWMQTENYFKQVHKNLGATINSINGSDLKKFPIIASDNLEEQQKIADFLSSVDKKIEQLTEKHRLLTEYKKGVMQQIFTQQIRFKDNQGNDYPEWENYTLGDVTSKVSVKNKDNRDLPVYSINNQQGFVPQGQQFEGVDSKSRNYDISMYKVIGKETFAYNPARINVGSLGFSGDLEDIIISSLYVCFKTKNMVLDSFLLSFFDTFEFNKSVLRNVEGGVRDYLFYENFSIIKISLPCLEEQQKIANFLTEIDQKIDQAWSTLEQTKAFKKGLLQKMFV